MPHLASYSPFLTSAVFLLVACGDDAGGMADTDVPATTSEGSGDAGSGTRGGSGSVDESGSETSDEGSTGGPPPDVADDAYFTVQDEPLAVDAAAGLVVNDAAGTSLLDADTATALGGSVAVADDGSFSYTPAAGSWGPDTFAYRATGPDGQSAEATVTVFVRPRVIPLAEVAAGQGGFVINGGEANEGLGLAVSGAGDVNGDGLADILVGDGEFRTDFFPDGRAYIVFGKEDTDPVAVDALGDRGFEIINAHVVVDTIPDILRVGSSLSGAGDFNGDGFADVIVVGDGSLAHGPISWIVFGKTDAEPVDLRSLGTGGIAIRGGAYCTGSSVAGIGDFDGDGFDDVALESSCNEPSSVYVLFGSAEPTEVDLDNSGGQSMRVFTANGGVGGVVSPAGDFNADGFDDFVTMTSDVGMYVLTAAVVFGGARSGEIDLEAFGDRVAMIGAHEGHRALRPPLGHVGDFDGDGSSDIFVSAPDEDVSYVLRGGVQTGEQSLEEIGDRAVLLDGFEVSAAGRHAFDVNADGFSDLIVGEPYAGGEGVALVTYGGSGSVSFDDVELGIGGFIIEGADPQDRAGEAVDGAGDINGDGVDDLIVGAPGPDFAGDHTRTFVVFGVRTTL